MKKRMLALLMAAAMSATMCMSVFAAETDDAANDISPNPKTETSQTAPVSVGTIATDVTEKDWFYNAVVTVVDAKIMETTDGKFNPGEPMTRSEIAVVLYNDAKSMKKETTDGGMAVKEAPDYAQVPDSAKEAMNFCFNAKILMGDDKGNLNPQAGVTREEMAALLERYCTFVGIGKADAADGMAIKEFTDFDSVQTWAHKSISFCLGNNVLKGNENGSYNPTGNVTRAECAQMITNMFALVAPAA